MLGGAVSVIAWTCISTLCFAWILHSLSPEYSVFPVAWILYSLLPELYLPSCTFAWSVDSAPNRSLFCWFLASIRAISCCELCRSCFASQRHQTEGSWSARKDKQIVPPLRTFWPSKIRSSCSSTTLCVCNGTEVHLHCEISTYTLPVSMFQKLTYSSQCSVQQLLRHFSLERQIETTPLRPVEAAEFRNLLLVVTPGQDV